MTKRISETEEKIYILKEYFGVKTDIELSKRLDIAHSTISNWKKRNAMDVNLIINKCPGMDWNYFLTGVKSGVGEELQKALEANKAIKAELKKTDSEIKEYDTFAVHTEITTTTDILEAQERIAKLEKENDNLKKAIINLATKGIGG